MIVAPIVCFLSQRLQILATCLFFILFSLTLQSLSKTGLTLYEGPLIFFDFVIYKKFEVGTCKMCNINAVQSC